MTMYDRKHALLLFRIDCSTAEYNSNSLTISAAGVSAALKSRRCTCPLSSRLGRRIDNIAAAVFRARLCECAP